MTAAPPSRGPAASSSAVLGPSAATFTSSSVPSLSVPLPSSGPARPPIPAQVEDVSFIDAEHGWALSSPVCHPGSDVSCPEDVLATDDGGATWRRVGAPDVAAVKLCGDPCVSQIRLASTTVGYVFGPLALFMTADGGRHWSRQSGGGADAIEAVNGAVVRITGGTAWNPCARHCALVQTAPVGSSHWTAQPAIAGWEREQGLLLARSAHVTYLLDIGFNPAKPTFPQSGALYTSTDDGRTWTSRGDVCPKAGHGYLDDSVALAAAPDGSADVACVTEPTPTSNPLDGHVVQTTDGGASFAAPLARDPFGPVFQLAAASASTVLVEAPNAPCYCGPGPLHRTTDGGHTWSVVAGPPADGLGPMSFTSAQDGYVLSETTLWTTGDDGRSWTSHSLT
jgi:photosystem II stability/assembly factor-like uncharacterized protein